MKRIFIAVKVEADESMLRLLSSLQEGLLNEKINWTRKENVHITLAFLGNIGEQMVNIVSTMLKEKCEDFGKFELLARGAGVYKNFNAPRVIWIGIEPSEELVKLQGLILRGLKELDILIEEGLFRPHLTLGRVKSIKNPDILKSLIEKHQNDEIQKYSVNDVTLYESILLGTGPVYNPIIKIKL